MPLLRDAPPPRRIPGISAQAQDRPIGPRLSLS